MTTEQRRAAWPAMRHAITVWGMDPATVVRIADHACRVAETRNAAGIIAETGTAKDRNVWRGPDNSPVHVAVMRGLRLARANRATYCVSCGGSHMADAAGYAVCTEAKADDDLRAVRSTHSASFGPNLSGDDPRDRPAPFIEPLHYGANYAGGVFTGFRKAPSPGISARGLYRTIKVDGRKIAGRTVVQSWTGAARDRELNRKRCADCGRRHADLPVAENDEGEIITITCLELAPVAKIRARGPRGRSPEAQARRKQKRARYRKKYAKR